MKYKNHYDEELPERIEKFFVKMNEHPATLQIELYFEWYNKPYKIVIFEYPACKGQDKGSFFTWQEESWNHLKRLTG